MGMNRSFSERKIPVLTLHLHFLCWESHNSNQRNTLNASSWQNCVIQETGARAGHERKGWKDQNFQAVHLVSIASKKVISLLPIGRPVLLHARGDQRNRQGHMELLASHAQWKLNWIAGDPALQLKSVVGFFMLLTRIDAWTQAWTQLQNGQQQSCCKHSPKYLEAVFIGRKADCFMLIKMLAISILC